MNLSCRGCEEGRGDDRSKGRGRKFFGGRKEDGERSVVAKNVRNDNETQTWAVEDGKKEEVTLGVMAEEERLLGVRKEDGGEVSSGEERKE